MRGSNQIAIVVAIGGAIIAGVIAHLLGATTAVAGFCALVGAVAGWASAHHDSAPAPAVAAASTVAPPDLDLLFAAFDEPVLLIDGRRVAKANAAAEALLGGHIIGEDVRLAIRHPAAAELLTGPLDAAARTVELVGVGTRDQRWELIVRPYGADARLVRLTDRTGTHAAEQMRVDFVANASHELKTPLATLLGFIETLDDPAVAADTATTGRFVKIMHGEAKRMHRLIDDLISLSRIEAEKFRPPQTAVALPDIVEEVRHAVLGGQGEDRIFVGCRDETPPVAGDRTQLSQLLHNLIGNALKYGRAGTPVRVTLAPAAGGMVELAVEDEGDGIAAEHLPRLTERFYRVDPGRSRALGGTGLGLAIAKHIVERHRGRMTIESTVGRGTTVRVLLPAAVAAAPVPAAAAG